MSEHGGKGLFCKTIEQELLDKNIDLAVHALKDMPTDETQGLLTNCFLERNNPREILISNGNKNISNSSSSNSCSSRSSSNSSSKKSCNNMRSGGSSNGTSSHSNNSSSNKHTNYYEDSRAIILIL